MLVRIRRIYEVEKESTAGILGKGHIEYWLEQKKKDV